MTRIPIHIVWERGVKLPENKLNNLMKEKNNNEVD